MQGRTVLKVQDNPMTFSLQRPKLKRLVVANAGNARQLDRFSFFIARGAANAAPLSRSGCHVCSLHRLRNETGNDSPGNCRYYLNSQTESQPDNYWHDSAYPTLEVAEVVAGINDLLMTLHRCEVCEP